jgi:hypothetical protein
MPFLDKAAWIRAKLNDIKVSWTDDCVKLLIKRSSIVEYSFTQIMRLTPRDIQKEFNIAFEGEIASDAGGVTRVWLNLLTEKLFAAESGLFMRCETDALCYSIVPGKCSDEMFSFAGRVFGKALLESVSIPCYLSKVLYKHLTQQSIELADLRFLDTPLYNSLRYISSNSIEGLTLDRFAVDKPSEGARALFELKPRGSEIEIDEGNKAEYCALRLEFETKTYFAEALKRLLEGFFQVVPMDLVQLLMYDELELMLCGLPWVDTANWKEHTQYRGVYGASHPVILWFWDCLENMTQPQLSSLLQFCTGSSRMPPEGFSSFRTLRGRSAPFTIESVECSSDSVYPRAHTCFNRLDLPLYSSKVALRQALDFLIENCNLEFGIE